MTVKDVAKVMGNQFIAVEFNGSIAYSGSANNFRGWMENRQVAEITAPKRANGATIIRIRDNVK